MVLIIMVSDELGSITSFVSTCCNRDEQSEVNMAGGWMDAVMKFDIPIVM